MKERLRKMGQLHPLNIFLRQEIDRMQRVITLVRVTLMDLKLAIDGTIIMSENLRDALDNMFDARVPNNWRKVRCLCVCVCVCVLTSLCLCVSILFVCLCILKDLKYIYFYNTHLLVSY